MSLYKNLRLKLSLLIAFGSNMLFAQPFVDVVAINHQVMSTKTVTDSFDTKFSNTYLNVMLPIKIDSGNYFLLRLNGELLGSKTSGFNKSGSADMRMAAIGVGWQHSFNEKFSSTLLFIPKIAGNMKDGITSNTFQMGATFLLQYRFNKNKRIKAGIYYNREPFGNFFVPLLGADIQINERNWIYGQLPLYYRYEHRFNKKLYSGIGFRFFGRSYRLDKSLNNNYFFLQENQFKVFFDYYLRPKFVSYIEFGRTVGYGFRQYRNGSARTDRQLQPMEYAPVNDGWMFNFGFAYRVRQNF